MTTSETYNDAIFKSNSESITSSRISRIQKRYQTQDLYISVERARYYTQSWEATAGKGIPTPVRISMAMKNVFENMTHYIDPDDRIAGYWTEHFLGIPIDIERGVFNKVLKAELTKKAIVLHRLRSFSKGLKYMVRKGTLLEFIKTQKTSKAQGAAPLDMGFKTMSQRSINPYQIRKEDQKELLEKLVPYWDGKAVVDRLESELIDSGLYSQGMYDFAIAIPGNTSRQVTMISTCAVIGSYQGHVILDHEKVLKVGLANMKHEVQDKLDTEELSEDERAFFESVKIAIEGVIIFSRRLAEAIEFKLMHETDPKQKEILERMFSNCREVPENPAQTFEQAVQSLWTIKTAVELVHPVNLHCFGRLDQILYPYYKKDIEAGRIDKDYASELLEELLLKIMSQNIRPESNILGNFYHRFLGSSPVTVGGIKPDGSDATNDLTYLFLEAAHRSKAITNMSLRVSQATPDALLLLVAKYLYEGTSSYSLYNDEISIEAMVRRGFSLEDARDYAVMGCVETTCPGKTGFMSANALQLMRLLDITMRNGDSRIMAGIIKNEGPTTLDIDSFENFEQFLESFFKQADYFLTKLVEGSNRRDRLYANHLPSPFISAFMDGCLKSKKDVARGGAKYDMAGISMINSIGNLIDSLYVIKKLVFEEKAFSLRTLLEAVDNNFIGYESILLRIQKLSGKWGNGYPEVDELARSVMKELFEKTYKFRTFNDNPFVVYVISMITHTIDGRLSIAGPDGRRASTPFAASCNPYNVERSGPTATLRSVASLPFEDVMGAAVNMKFHPTGIGLSQVTREKWSSLIRTYFQLGGSQLQPTVVSPEQLKKAVSNPDEYRDLIVKVGGYSTYFVDLGREIQQEVIDRTMHL